MCNYFLADFNPNLQVTDAWCYAVAIVREASVMRFPTIFDKEVVLCNALIDDKNAL